MVSLKLLLFSIILVLVALIFNTLNQRLSERSGMEVLKSEEHRTVVVIDAGHGGEDGGAVGINGCIEKDINLEIALTLYDLLRFSDIPVLLTRDSDIMLYEDADAGHKKRQDLNKRLEIAESYDNSILVSIHMNTYPSEKYRGAQVYYSPNNEKSKELAELIQNELRSVLSPDNNRQTKEAGSSIFLLNNASHPSVLVECGFISNAAEAELLCSESYRDKLSLTIYTSIIKYLSDQRK